MTTDLVVVVPSRGRPQHAHTIVEAFQATCTADTQLLFAVDDDDPSRGEYPKGLTAALRSRSMNEALNLSAVALAGDAFAVGFMGDDHLPRTTGWDAAYVAALRELGTGIVYGNDLMQGRGLPTQCAMTTDIVRALGYMAPPSLTHLWLDNFWLSLGREADCIRYLPDVVVEHRHPLMGKAQWDAGYERVNATEMQDRDRSAFAAYVDSGEFAAAVAKVRALRAVVTS
jgi:hypothetical protein